MKILFYLCISILLLLIILEMTEGQVVLNDYDYNNCVDLFNKKKWFDRMSIYSLDIKDINYINYIKEISQQLYQVCYWNDRDYKDEL